MITDRETVFATPWFSVEAKQTSLDLRPFYSLRLVDYVRVITVTSEGELLLVRQYRPAIERFTLEIPGGMLDPGETPASAAEREVVEEVGRVPERLVALGELWPDSGRLQNRMWCYLAHVGEPIPDWAPETGVEVVSRSRRQLWDDVAAGRFSHAPDMGVLLLALAQDHLRLIEDSNQVHEI